jgi:integrase
MEKKSTKRVLLSRSQNIALRAEKIKIGYTLLLDIHLNGKRKYEFLKLQISTIDKRKFTPADRENIKVAESIKAKRILEIANGMYGMNEQYSYNSSFLDYLIKIAEKKKAEEDKAQYKWAGTLLHFKEFSAGKKVAFRDITPAFLEDFKTYLLKKIKQNTAHGYFNFVAHALKLAVRDKIIKSNPADEVKRIGATDPNREYLVLEEIKKLHNTECRHPETKRAFLFCCFTGLRLSDVVALTWSNIREENGDLILYFRQQKGDKPERMHLSQQAIEYIGERKKSNEKVFKLINLRHISDHFTDWLKAAELEKKVTFHTSRHTFATLALTYGVELKTVSSLLGHADIKTTEIYAKIIDKKKQEAVAKLPTF